MSETPQHLALVQSLKQFVENSFSLAHFAVFADLPGSSDKPPRVYGFVPDIYAEDAPRTTLVIGEAKTREDLTTPHSRAQIAAFVRYASQQPNGMFVLAVPWSVSVPAQQIVEECQERFNAQHLKVVILDGVRTRAAASSSA